MNLNTRLEEKERIYTGVELRPHFLLTELDLKGHALGSFIGPCRVQTEHLVDWEDRLASDRIEAASMVHFIAEVFHLSGATGLREGVLFQRLFMASIAQTLNDRLEKKGKAVWRIRREGDDLFVLGRKLSVSIVTASPVSLLLHTGINIDPAGAPVPAVGLAELGFSALEVREWVKELLASFAEEWASIDWACAKVRPVL